MNGSEHYREGERLLSQASMFTHEGGPFVDPARSAALAAMATAHFAAAQAAATALPTVVQMMGDSAEVTAWAIAIGAADKLTEPGDVPKAVILPECWPPIAGDSWGIPDGDAWGAHPVWFAQSTPDGIRMIPAHASDEGLDTDAALTPEQLLKQGEPKLLHRNPWEPPF